MKRFIGLALCVASIFLCVPASASAPLAAHTAPQQKQFTLPQHLAQAIAEQRASGKLYDPDYEIASRTVDAAGGVHVVFVDMKSARAKATFWARRAGRIKQDAYPNNVLGGCYSGVCWGETPNNPCQDCDWNPLDSNTEPPAPNNAYDGGDPSGTDPTPPPQDICVFGANIDYYVGTEQCYYQGTWTPFNGDPGGNPIWGWIFLYQTLHTALQCANPPTGASYSWSWTGSFYSIAACPTPTAFNRKVGGGQVPATWQVTSEFFATGDVPKFKTIPGTFQNGQNVFVEYDVNEPKLATVAGLNFVPDEGPPRFGSGYSVMNPIWRPGT